MKQIAVVSGKGGTGKTSLVASLAALASGRAVYADCDVDAPDLHLILQPEIKERREFFGIKRAFIDSSKCTQCGSCQDACRFAAIADFQVNPALCEGCGVCKLVCPAEAVEMRESLAGYAYISETRFGPLVHAELFPGEEASGKLVAMVREMARDSGRIPQAGSGPDRRLSRHRLPGDSLAYRSRPGPGGDRAHHHRRARPGEDPGRG